MSKGNWHRNDFMGYRLNGRERGISELDAKRFSAMDGSISFALQYKVHFWCEQGRGAGWCSLQSADGALLISEKLKVLEMGMKHPIGIVCLCALTGTLLLSTGTSAAADECSAIKLDFGQKSVTWAHLPLSKLKRDTVYTLLDTDGRQILHAEANGSASLYGTRLKQPVAVPKTLDWRWKTDALIPGADNRDKNREDAPLRLIVAFDGDSKSLPEAEQKRLRRAKTLSGREPPFATLIYIWSDQVPVNTIIPSAHTSQVKMLVAASGMNGLGTWQAVRRNLAEDYRLAYGKQPGRVIGVGVMTDTDNIGAKAIGEYADIRFSCTAD